MIFLLSLSINFNVIVKKVKGLSVKEGKDSILLFRSENEVLKKENARLKRGLVAFLQLILVPKSNQKF